MVYPLQSPQAGAFRASLALCVPQVLTQPRESRSLRASRQIATRPHRRGSRTSFVHSLCQRCGNHVPKVSHRWDSAAPPLLHSTHYHGR